MKKYLLIILAVTIGVLSNPFSVQATLFSTKDYSHQLEIAIKEGNLELIKHLYSIGVPITSKQITPKKLEQIIQDGINGTSECANDETRDEITKRYIRVCEYIQKKSLENFDSQTARMNKEFIFVAAVCLASMSIYHLLVG
jgi:hypothetical protein